MTLTVPLPPIPWRYEFSPPDPGARLLGITLFVNVVHRVASISQRPPLTHHHRVEVVYPHEANRHDPPVAERVVAFYNQRGKAEQFIKEGKNAIKWTRLSCRKLRDNEVRLQLHALAYNLANFMRTLALPKEVEHWSLTTLREKLVKIGAKVVRHGRYVTFQSAEVAVPRSLFQQILELINDLRRRPVPA